MSLRSRQQAPEVTERPAKRSCYKHRMRDPPTSVTQAGMDVLQFQIRQFFHDLFGGKTVGKQLKNIADSNSHSAPTRLPAATRAHARRLAANVPLRLLITDSSLSFSQDPLRRRETSVSGR